MLFMRSTSASAREAKSGANQRGTTESQMPSMPTERTARQRLPSLFGADLAAVLAATSALTRSGCRAASNRPTMPPSEMPQ
jgi:hypothetical protein